MSFLSRVVLGALVSALVLTGVLLYVRHTTPVPSQATLSVSAALGEKIFNDRNLSVSRAQSCATCHVAEHAHAAGDGLPAPMGGEQLQTQGFRNVPTLRYLDQNTEFHFVKEEDGSQTPTGGFDWDGRAASFAEQASGPLFGPHEMGLKGPADLQARLQAAAYAADVRAVFGADALDTPASALKSASRALSAFQKEDPRFHPYDSKYDLYLAGKAELSEQEQRGLKLFEDENKGNCAACHPSQRGPKGEPPLFTDFTYDVLGAPRNPKLEATAKPEYFDLGLCGPDRKDLAERKDLCGAFRVPTLRNIAITGPYFHNGSFDKLEDVVAFYVRRDTNPEQWYPSSGKGKALKVAKFDDLPTELHGNVNTAEKPYDRKPGEKPALDEAEIADLVAFLKTLTDGYKPE